MPFRLRAGQQVEKRSVFVVPAVCPRHEHHVHITTVRHLAQLGRKLVLGEDPAAELCCLPQQVPLGHGHQQLSRVRVGARYRHGHILRQDRGQGTGNPFVEVACGHVADARVLIGGQPAGVLENFAAFEVIDLPSRWLRIAGRRGNRSLCHHCHDYITTTCAVFVPLPARDTYAACSRCLRCLAAARCRALGVVANLLVARRHGRTWIPAGPGARAARLGALLAANDQRRLATLSDAQPHSAR